MRVDGRSFRQLLSLAGASLLMLLAACAGGPQIGYESAPDAMQQANAVDSGEARALEQAEADCARQGKHAVSQRTEGETIYDCSD
jgi:hypothetical protein